MRILYQLKKRKKSKSLMLFFHSSNQDYSSSERLGTLLKTFTHTHTRTHTALCCWTCWVFFNKKITFSSFLTIINILIQSLYPYWYIQLEHILVFFPLCLWHREVPSTRGRIRDTAAGHVCNTRSLTHEWGQGSNPHPHRHHVRSLAQWTTTGTLTHYFFRPHNML